MPIAETIAAIKGALDVSKVVNDLVNRPDIDVVEVRSKVHQMLIHVVNAQTGLAEAQQEINELRQRLDDREVHKALEADMEYQTDGGFYTRKTEQERGIIAYCPICWKKDDRAIPMQPSAIPGWFRCNIHHIVHETNQCRELKRANSKRPAQITPSSWTS